MTDGNVARCTKCGRPLTDPKSVKLGMGRECRNGGKTSAKISRTFSYMSGKDVVVGDITFKKKDDYWTGSTDRKITDEELKKYLTRYNLIDIHFLDNGETYNVG